MKKYILFIAIISIVIYIVEPDYSDYELKDFALPVLIIVGTYLLRWFMKK